MTAKFTEQPPTKTLLADGHVHIHGCFDLELFLDAAAASFARIAREIGAWDWIGCLLLAEGMRETAFDDLKGQVGRRVTKWWLCHGTGEDECLRLVRRDGIELFLVCGGQVVTQENLEVLVLGTTLRIPDGVPIREVIERCHAVGGLPVVPWGFGKWWFGRGRRLRKLVEAESEQQFLLGDNGGRPAFAWRPHLFGLAERLGVWIIPGSDPLPFRNQVGRAGSYVFALPNWADGGRLVATLRSRLLNLSQSPPVYGRRESVFWFAIMQFRMQLRKYRRRKAR